MTELTRIVSSYNALQIESTTFQKQKESNEEGRVTSQDLLQLFPAINLLLPPVFLTDRDFNPLAFPRSPCVALHVIEYVSAPFRRDVYPGPLGRCRGDPRFNACGEPYHEPF